MHIIKSNFQKIIEESVTDILNVNETSQQFIIIENACTHCTKL